MSSPSLLRSSRACTETPQRFLLGYLLKCASASPSSARAAQRPHSSDSTCTHSLSQRGPAIKVRGVGSEGCGEAAASSALNVRLTPEPRGSRKKTHKTRTCIQPGVRLEAHRMDRNETRPQNVCAHAKKKKIRLPCRPQAQGCDGGSVTQQSLAHTPFSLPPPSDGLLFSHRERFVCFSDCSN